MAPCSLCPLERTSFPIRTMRYFQFHFEDTWRMRPSLTLTYGLTYSWLTPLRGETRPDCPDYRSQYGRSPFRPGELPAQPKKRRRVRARSSTRRSGACGRSTIRPATHSPIPTTATLVREWRSRGAPKFKNGPLGMLNRSAHGSKRRLWHRLLPRQHDLGAPPRSLRHRLC